MKKIICFFAACIFSFSASAQLIVQSGATLYLSGNALVVLQDVNLVNDGTITVAAIGRFSFTGIANSGISGTQQPAFNELKIAKTGSNKLLLERAIDVNGKIPSISFSSAGNFTDNGALKELYHEYISCLNPAVTPCSGSYEVKDYTILFNYSDGRKIKLTFLGAGYDINNKSRAMLRMSPNEDPMTKQ